MQLVHRDVSPQNILISRAGHVKVADFGVAKALGGSREATAVGKVRGKLSYMSPEQAQGQPLDRRSDVFSLGVVSYFATTGVHPFRRSGESHDEQFMRLLLDQVRAPSELVPGYPRELENIVMRAISRNPELRFATADIAHAVFDRVGRFMDQRAQRIQACIRAGQDEPGTDAARLLRTSDVTFVPTTSRAEQWQGHSLTANVLPQPRSMARSMVSTLAAAAIGVAATLMFIGSRGPANDVEAAGIAPVPAALAEAAAPPPKTETTEPPALPARALPASAEAKRVARAAAQKAAQSDALAIRRSRTSAELHRAPRRDTPADSRTDAVTKPSRGDVVAPAPSRRSSPSRVRPSRTMGPLKNGP
jgi:serine/threonine-protein kinase